MVFVHVYQRVRVGDYVRGLWWDRCYWSRVTGSRMWSGYLAFARSVGIDGHRDLLVVYFRTSLYILSPGNYR